MIKKQCKQCGKEFVLSDSEIKFFKEKKLELPKRCSECRKENKNSKVNNNDKVNNISNVKKDTNYKSHSYDNKRSGNKKTFRSIIATGLVVLVLLLGKIFNIEINWQDLSTSFGNEQTNVSLEFRNETMWEEHFVKHGNEFDYDTKEEYLRGANEVINSSSSKHKIEAEDGDDIYYDVNKNEIVFVSSDGYIRTYFKPSDGIEYFNRQ